MLPPEGPSASAPPLPGLLDSRTASREDVMELLLRRQIERRNRLALVVLLTVIAVAGAAALVRAFLPSFRSAPVAAVVEEETAFAQLRKDDPTSRAKAIAHLRALTATQPRYVEAQAALTLALLLDLDDRRAVIHRYMREEEALEDPQKARLESERPGTDWRVLANRLVDRIAALRAKMAPLNDDAKGLQAQVNAAYAVLMKMEALQPARESLAKTRTDAIYAAIDGQDQAIVLAERYRQMGGQDGWAEVANAEYALNTKGVPPETVAQDLDQMRALQKRDTTFLRAYVLGGRLALQLKQKDVAASQLDAAVALNPDHILAQTLAEDARVPEPH